MNGATENKGPLSIEDVLADEVQIIHGKALAAEAEGQDAQEKRKNLNADNRGLIDRDDDDVQSRDEFYVALNKLNQSALCCSGGGIRSATFCLGVIQAFANYDVDAGELRGKAAAIARSDESGTAAPPGDQANEAAGSKSGTCTPIDPKVSALGRFHYLSTVSGGGYIGSWLSAWRSRSDFSTVVANLTSRPNGPDIEPPEISWLRAYSNYLTPRLGIASADSWAAVAIFVRNLVLNWLVIIPLVCLVLLGLKEIATGGVLIAHWSGRFVLLIVALGILCLIFAQAFTTRHRPSRRTGGDKIGEKSFRGCDLLCAVLSAVFLTIFFSSQYFASLIGGEHCQGFAAVTWNGLSPKLTLLLAMAIAGSVIYALGWSLGDAWASMTGAPLSENQKDNDREWWAASGLVYGGIVGLGAYLFTLLAPYSGRDCSPSEQDLHLLLPTVLGVPWILMAQMLAEIVFVGLTCYEDGSDADREWLGRAGGWLAAATVAWALTAFLVFAGGYFVQETDVVQQGVAHLRHPKLIDAGALTGLLSGLLTALLGGSSKTPAKSSGNGQAGLVTFAYNVVLAVSGPIFVAVLIIALSVGLDRMLLQRTLSGSLVETHYSLIKILQTGQPVELSVAAGWLFIGLIIVAAVGSLASYCVNINRFSLHALYRNRLTRCYLGASNATRDPDPFSGFDFGDNLCVYKLWPPKESEKTGSNSFSLFHVINIALNVVSPKRLAWQERKAESFTVSPRHCGSAYVGYRNSDKYGGDGGLSLGTAMAISGAAVSPNMGYHSSPSIALLLTLFNVRLGWWLGSPGKKGKEMSGGGKIYEKDGPAWSATALLDEALGKTTDESEYVYLSDGGHFENLGLYEMVRRRCRFIVVVDAGCDPDFAFGDLGNAVRKIYIDLGIRITFSDLGSLADRPSVKSRSRAKLDAAALAIIHAADRTKKKGEQGSKIGPPGDTPYHAIGVIHYREADHTEPVAHVETVETVEIVETANTIEIVDTVETVETVENGYILYIKPAYHGTEKSAGIRSYATANPTFPHETTADQWFTESQFESYRSLGLDIGSRILNHDIVLRENPKLTLHDALKAVKVQTPP
jgi:hypothetical protein